MSNAMIPVPNVSPGESARVCAEADAIQARRDAERNYRVVRFYQGNTPTRTIHRNLTLAEAQAHCSDPQSSSSTCTSAVGRARTRRLGPWFDGYTDK